MKRSLYFFIVAIMFFASEVSTQGFVPLKLPGVEKESEKIIRQENMSQIVSCDNDQSTITTYEVGEDFVEVVLLKRSGDIAYTLGRGRQIKHYFWLNNVTEKIESISQNDFFYNKIIDYFNLSKAYRGLSSDCKYIKF